MRRFPTVCVGLVLLGVVGLPPGVAAAAADGESNSKTNTYLALGDSVPFGFDPLVVQPGVDPDVLVGYPELASDLFHPQKKLFNASCPGETSTSLITGHRPDNGCQDYREFIGSLHVSYSGSQLDYAKSFIAANPRTELVTMMIGANDLFRLLDRCSGSPNPKCVTNRLPDLLTTLGGNLRTIYSTLRHAGFHGDLVAVTYYALDFRDPAGVALIGAVNRKLATVTRAFDGDVASGFEAFQAAARSFGGDSCAAGLLVRLTPSTCDVHPSPAGAALLADAVRHAD
jgi:GDSL-like Lipase/Acylhydrolase family